MGTTTSIQRLVEDPVVSHRYGFKFLNPELFMSGWDLKVRNTRGAEITATCPTQMGPFVSAASLGVRTRLETEMAVWETGVAMTRVTAMMGK